MKYAHSSIFLIFITLFSLVSCKGATNSTSEELSVRKFAFDTSSFMKVPYNRGESLLRSKMLNSALESMLQKKITPQPNAILAEDTFKLKNENVKLNPQALREYQDFSANAAQIIVSYTDHLEIYFVPTGISRDKALLQLGLTPDHDASFNWVQSNDTYLYKNKTYYLLSSTKKELKENDVFYVSENKNLNNMLDGKALTFSRHQVLKLKIKADYFSVATIIQDSTGPYLTCNRERMESGACGYCDYKIEASTGKLVQQKVSDLSHFNLDIFINGRSYPLNELKTTFDKEGNLNLSLDLKFFINSEFAAVSFLQLVQPRLLKTVNGFNYSTGCKVIHNQAILDLTPSLNLNVEMTVLGRSLETI